MSLEIEFDWENPQAAKGPELRATWARLTIMINDRPITQVQDYEVRGVRDSIYVPLYPVAEWLAMHWWPLFHEYENPRRAVQESYARRHNLRFAREGFALPDLEIRPTGPQMCFTWKPLGMPACKVRFLQDGTARLDTDMVYEKFASFIRAVVKRLEAEGLSHTPLEDEWIATETTDYEEREFCESAAALGLDPYSLTDEDRQAIVRAGDMLPEGLRKDFFSSADMSHLSTQLEELIDGRNKIRALPGDLTPLKDLRRDTQKIDALCTSWEEGYAFARTLRRHLGIEERLIKDIHEFGACLNVHGKLQEVILSTIGNSRFFEALVDVNDKESPGFLIQRQRKASKNFAFCRGLFEYLTSEAGVPVLISAACSERQQRNRAFAAEFLAPVALLKARLPSETLDEEEVEDLADVFGVASYIIRHQIENHHLARLM